MSPSTDSSQAAVLNTPGQHHRPLSNRANLDEFFKERLAIASPRDTSFWRGTKPQPATLEDIANVLQYIKNELHNTRLECITHTEDAVGKLRREVRELADGLAETKAADEARCLSSARQATSFTEECCSALRQELRSTASSLESLTKEVCGNLESDLKDLRNIQLQHLQQRLDEARQQMHDELVSRACTLTSDLGVARDEQDKVLRSTAAQLHQEVVATCEAVRTELTRQLVQLVSKQELDAAQHRQFMEAGAELQNQFLEFEARQREAAERSLSVQATRLGCAEERLGVILEEHAGRLQRLERHARETGDTISQVANLPTRRVEWRLLNATQWLSQVSRGAADRSAWASPHFEAAGVHGLRLELALHPSTAVTGGPDDEEAEDDFELRLWAGAGLSLVFRLYAGAASAQLQHRFDGLAPCGSGRLCRLAGQVADDDTLLLGLEILEAVVEVHDPQRLKSALQDEAETEDGAPETIMVAHQYLNHRTLELVQSQVESIRSRLVRRIEWRVEQASALRRFPEGESICSTAFSAAGIEGLQFVFFPQGYPGAKEGFCSLFLFCPGGTQMRCWLSAGKQRREARLSFEQQGFLGRTNFCRLDSCVESNDDTLLLVLEIEEAQQSVRETLMHTPVGAALESPQRPGSSRTRTARSLSGRPPVAGKGAAAPAGSSPASLPPEAGAPVQPAPAALACPVAIDSVMKLQRATGGVALEDVQLLPSIWTPRPPGDITTALDGFHQFSALKSWRKPGSSSGRRPPGGPAPGSHGATGFELPSKPIEHTPWAEASHRSAAAAPTRRYDMYAK